MPDMGVSSPDKEGYSFRKVGSIKIDGRDIPLVERYPGQLGEVTEGTIRAIEKQINSR